MMAKKKQWKQQIRAEVAAAMQGNRAGAVVTAETNIKNKELSPESSQKPAAVAAPETMRDLPLIRQDLTRIGVVTGLLLVLIVGLTVADRRSGILSRAYTQVSQVANSAKNQSPSPTISGTAPATTSPAQ